MKDIPQTDEIQKRMEAAIEAGDAPRKPREDGDNKGKGGRDRRPRRSA